MTAEPHPLQGDRGTDLHWSARALELGLQADFRTSPNPMVGAVVLDRQGYLAGEGYHRAAGQPHAEEEALAKAGDRAKGGTLYVNLEPCTHAHRSPSCADAVIESGIYRVVVSITDPDERVRGGGIKALELTGEKNPPAHQQPEEDLRPRRLRPGGRRTRPDPHQIEPAQRALLENQE